MEKTSWRQKYSCDCSGVTNTCVSLPSLLLYGVSNEVRCLKDPSVLIKVLIYVLWLKCMKETLVLPPLWTERHVNWCYKATGGMTWRVKGPRLQFHAIFSFREHQLCHRLLEQAAFVTVLLQPSILRGVLSPQKDCKLAFFISSCIL